VSSWHVLGWTLPFHLPTSISVSQQRSHMPPPHAYPFRHCSLSLPTSAFPDDFQYTLAQRCSHHSTGHISRSITPGVRRYFVPSTARRPNWITTQRSNTRMDRNLNCTCSQTHTHAHKKAQYNAQKRVKNYNLTQFTLDITHAQLNFMRKWTASRISYKHRYNARYHTTRKAAATAHSHFYS